jgi:hypothetical protein
MEIIRMWNNNFVMYMYKVKEDVFNCTMLPRLEYFERLSDRWIVEEEEQAWEEAIDAPANDAWEEEVPEPPHQEVLEEVLATPVQDEWYAPAPPALDAWDYAPSAPEYHPGEGSSSQWGNEGAPPKWAQWG